MNNLGNKNIELKIERAIDVLCEYMPIGEERKKPILMHALRVGMNLYERGYSEDIVLGGFLHDVIEWTDSPETVVRELFGQTTLDIILANTQNRAIESKEDQWRDMVMRCVAFGKDALVVKAADTLDSLEFYRAIGNENEIRRSKTIASMILDNLSGAEDPIFEQLRTKMAA